MGWCTEHACSEIVCRNLHVPDGVRTSSPYRTAAKVPPAPVPVTASVVSGSENRIVGDDDVEVLEAARRRHARFYDHGDASVSGGELRKTCTPPGYWSRLMNGVRYGDAWTCSTCGGVWLFKYDTWIHDLRLAEGTVTIDVMGRKDRIEEELQSKLRQAGWKDADYTKMHPLFHLKATLTVIQKGEE